ncbi:MAG: protein kinase [Planctomycetota bacterium]
MLEEREVRLLLAALQEMALTPQEASKVLDEASEKSSSSLAELLVEKGYVDRRSLQSAPAIPEIPNTVAWTPADSRNTTPRVFLPGATSGEAKRQDNTGARAKWLGSNASFVVESEIARGGLGRVLLARDEYLGREVAVKEILPHREASTNFVNRFFHEAQVTGQLEHPGIVPVYSLGIQTDGKPFYVMKLVRGTTLADSIHEFHHGRSDESTKSLAFDQLLRRFVDVCQALAFAHSRGVLHRDLKPQNVMLGDFGETIVVDWGLAKIRSQDQSLAADDLESKSSLGIETQAGAILGTPAYMPPEQAAGKLDSLDQRSDVFALGAILYEILVGRAPYAGADKYEILAKATSCALEEPREARSSVPKPLNAICKKAMSARMEDRYPDAQTLAEEIVRWQTGEPVQAYPDPWYVSVARFLRRHRTLALGTAAAVGSVAILLAGLAIRERRQDVIRDAEIAKLLSSGQKEIIAGNWLAARDPLLRALTLANEDVDHAARASEGRELLVSVDSQLGELERKRKAQETWTRFQDLQADVLFLQSFSIDSSGRPLQDKVNEALRLFGITSPDSKLWVDEELYSEQQRKRIVSFCRELIVARARAEVQSQTGGKVDPATLENAMAWLDLAFRLGPPLQSIELERSRLFTLVGQPRESERARAQAVKLQPAEPSDFILLAEQQYADANYEDAKTWLDRALALDPSRFSALYLKGACDLWLENWQSAIDGLTACASLRPDFLGIYLLRGFARGAQGDYVEAEKDFQTAHALDANQPALYLNRGLIRLRQERLDEAAAEFKTAIELDPQSAAGHLNLAEVHFKRKEFEQALAEIDRASELTPGLSKPHRSRARVLVAQGKTSQAIEELQKSLALDRNGSERAKDHTELGKLLQKSGRVEDALKEYKLAVREKPEYAEAYLQMGIAHADLKQPEKTLEAFDQYETRLPSKDEPRNTESQERRTKAIFFRERALARMLTEDMEGGLADALRANQLEPDVKAFKEPADQDRFTNMNTRTGWSLLGPTAWKMALEDFNAAIQNPKADGEPYAGRGFAKVLLGGHASAIQDAEAAYTRGPRKPGHLFNVACIYAQAVARVREDDKLPKRDELAKEYAARAEVLLREAETLVPAEVRGAFIQATLTDIAFDPIRQSPLLKQWRDENQTGR